MSQTYCTICSLFLEHEKRDMELTIDGVFNKRQLREILLFYMKYEDKKMIVIESWDGLHEVEMKVCAENAIITTHNNFKPQHGRLIHCGNETGRIITIYRRDELRCRQQQMKTVWTLCYG